MRRHRSLLAALAAFLAAALVAVGEPKAETKDSKPDPNAVFAPELFQTLEYRVVGPSRGGRVTAVAGVAQDRDTFWFGSTGGGVWKTIDGGASWKPMADEPLKGGSIGAIAVAPSDPNVIWVGTGSACPRGNVSPGTGMWRSTDGGDSWKQAGLADAGQIARVRVHPQDPDLAYAAALGHAFGPNAERGVFRTKDGGRTWENILFVSDRAGAVDLSMDPANPRILYAAIWQAVRRPWTLESGGPDSGLWKSKDGGDTWEKLTEGLPKGPLGRIGVAASGVKQGRVWAMVEAAEGGLFRSDDGGKGWRKVTDDRNLRQRPWYYNHVFADPREADTVYVLNVAMWRSRDGGRTFEPIRAPHGDHHDLWIHPSDPGLMINGNDGGANVSYNGGQSWSSQLNQPTAEFYRLATSASFPYRIYGCQQDNTCVSIASRTESGGIGLQDWNVIGGGESGHVAVDPRDPEVTYAGSYGGYITRHDHRTGQERNITPAPQVAVGLGAKDLRYRFQWNAPIRLSPHDPDTLYFCSNVVLRSRDQGQSWETISPDLTRNDPAKQAPSGGDLTHDNTGVEVYGTIFAFEESPKVRGLLWAGTDDGRVHLSRDAGATWKEITPARMPEWGQVNMIELSPHDPGRAFLAVTRYKADDFKPYIFRTDDYGGSWVLLATGENGVPAGHFVRVVREDPDRKGLLYAGTEFGVYVSFDDGKRWQRFQQKLPVTPITDLQVKEKDLVVATQGRSFWVLDDLTPLHQLTHAAADAPAFLFAPRDFTLFSGGEGGSQGKSAPRGIVIQWLLEDEIKPDAAKPDEVLLEVLDSSGAVLRRMSNLKDEPRAPNPYEQFMPEPARPRKLTSKKGMNRWVWDLRLPDAQLVDDAVVWDSAAGPRVPPGTYRVRLTAAGTTQEREVRVLRDPRLATSDDDLQARFDLARRISDAASESNRAVRRARDVKQQVADLLKRLEAAGKGDGLSESANALTEKLTAIEERLHNPKIKSSQDVLNYPTALDGQLLGLQSVVESADAAPTRAAAERYAELRKDLDGILAELQGVLDADLAAWNDAVRKKDVPPVVVPR